MKKFILLAAAALTLSTYSNAQWKPVGDKIKTQWAEQINPNNVLPEYPRPIMERQEWQNLNGMWKYAIRDKGEAAPQAYDGDILVPFAVESSLSGVGKHPTETQELWYSREFNVPKTWTGKRVLLHFGAVDWKADVWVNNVRVGGHTGGFTPFSLDITDALAAKGGNTLTVRVWDPTDKSYQPRGKQVSEPGGIWYTPVTGIWQTVWMEPVAEAHIADLKITPDIDNHELNVGVQTTATAAGYQAKVQVFDGTAKIAEGASVNGLPVSVSMPANAKLWTPDSPHLYTLKVSLLKDGREVDAVDSYAAMRKISMARDKDGIMRMQLNNKNIFMYGPLDQGWWPDGLYTAPTDEALKYDIQKTKDFGFNMIRKHIKVEPARWYTYCDQLGILVWQDMPSGDGEPEWQTHEYFTGTELKRSAASEANYRKEWKEEIDVLYNYPSIAVWIPFNERWGQFKTVEIAEWTKAYDPSRLVNPASGGNFYTTGDILDLHNYPQPEMYLFDAQRVNALGEYGGIGRVVRDHIWEPDRNWGYVQFNTEEEVTNEYVKYAQQLKDLVARGFSGAVYTQTTDVEIEVNGLMTYDRKVIKLNESRVRQINQAVINSLAE